MILIEIMRSKIAQRILDKTPEDVEIFVRLYGDIVVRVNELIKEKGITQKELAEGMNKRPSEISKWLNGEHNFTLRSLARLQAELGEPIVYVPKRKSFQYVSGKPLSMTVLRNDISVRDKFFVEGKSNKKPLKTRIA